MKKFYVSFLHILLWVLGSMAVSHKAMAQYTSSVLETGKYYTAIAKDNLDNIYVVAYNSATTKYQVLKYTNGAGTPTPIYQGLSLTVSEYPWSIAVNSAGDVFIMDPDVASNWRIVKLAAGSYTSSIIQSGRYFTALTVDNSDNLLAMEYDAATTNYRVVKYDALNLTGSGTTVYNGLPLATGSGTYPWGIVTDHSNNIYIIDFPYNSFNGRLIKLTAPAYTATTLGSGKNYTSLAIDGQDNLYTSEELSGTTSHVMKYTAPVSAGATGTEIATGLTIGSFFYPWGIAVNSHGDVFIDDGAAPGNGRVIKLSSLAISVASVTRASNNPTTASTVQYTVTFSATATNVTTSAFSLNTTGLTGASIAAVTGSGTTYTVTVNTGTGNGTLELVVTGNNMGNTVSGVPVNTGVLYTVDKTAPTITSVDVPANGIYHLNDGLRFKAHFSEPITVTGTPVLDITIGGTTRQATYQGGSGSDTLGFLYVVQAGDVDMDGIALGAAITGTVKDAAGNNAILTLPAVNTTGVLVNTNSPSVTISTTATSPVTAPFTATITFSEAVTAFVLGDINATNATLGTLLTADNITYTVLVTPTADGPITLQVPAGVAINLGNNTNTASNILNLTFDGTAPTITALDVPANGIYHLNDGLRFKAHFSESIAVTGTPTLDITIGGTTRQATYLGGSGSDTLGFLYVVQAGDVDMDGIALDAAITGTVKDAAGNNAVLTLPAVNTTGVLVNTNSPSVTISTTATSPVTAPFTATITFSEAVTAFVLGDINATNATLGTLLTADNITYTVLVTPTADGPITLQVPAGVAINLGNNTNTASNILNLTFDGTAPTITALDVPANGIYHLNDGLRFKAHFSESIAVTGTPTLDITIGGTTRQATYQGGSGSDTLGFLYVVQAGDVDMDGIALGAAITGAVKDAAGNNAVLTLPAVNTTGVLVNTNSPSVTISTTATSPVTAPFTATITFSEAVTAFVLGDINATNATLGTLLTADNITYTVLVTPTADGPITLQVPAGVAINLGNNTNTASNILNLTFDGTAPTITALDVPTNGIYHLNDGLRFKAHFSESIAVTGTPTLDITIGGTTRQATYLGGSGSDTLGFLYVVQAGDVDMDGIALGAAITGTVKDAAGNNAVLTLPAVNTTGVLVNTNSPSATISTTATSPVTAPFTATITFSEAVTGFVLGDINATNATLGTLLTADNITYTVVVTPTADGTVTLQVPAGVAVNSGNNNNTASNVLSRDYDGTAPTITALDVPANGIYHLNDGLRFKAHFNEPITVTGTPTLDITIGGTTRQATYLGGSGSDTLGFLYIVQAGDVDMDGIALGAAITGTVKDAAGNNAVLTLPAVNTTGVLVNTNSPSVTISTTATSPLTAPFTATITFSEAVTGFVLGDINATNATLSAFHTTDNITYTVLVTPTADGPITLQVPAGVAINLGNNTNTASNILNLTFDGTAPTITALDVPANGIYHLNDGLRFKAHFSEPITVTGTPVLDITIGGTTRQATYQGGSGSDTLGFLYVVQAGDVDMDGIALGAAITGTVKDAAGNNAVLALPAVNTTGVLVNTNSPSATISTTATSPVTAPFTATITFSEAVTAFVLGDINATNATLGTLLTADNITYTVLVTPTADGPITLQVPAGVAINLGNNTNTASNILNLTFDGTAPTITALDVPANGIYHLNDGLRFKAHFSESIAVTGTPTLDITIGGTTRQATYLGGSGSDTLGFLYVVQAGDVDMDGIALDAAITGTVKDAAGNNAVLTLPAVNTTGVLVNTNTPGVAISTTATSPVIAPFTATITFSEAVTGFVLGDINATNATLSAFHTTDNITYTALVTPTADGTITLQVPAGVAINPGNNANTASNILNLTFDGTAPTITALDVPANGIYHLNDGLRFKAHFSESITVTGTPTLDITIGGTTRQAAYQGGSGSDTLGFLYVVQAGDVDMDGIALGAAITGTVKDAAGNNAVLTLPAVNTTGVLVNTNSPSVTISTTATSPVIAPFTVTITFSEAVTGFVLGDINATNATLSAFQTTDNITYTALVTPTADGTVTLQVSAGIAANVGNNANTASNTLSVVFAGTAPVVTAVDVPANATYRLGQVLSFTVHFSEPVTVTGASSLDITIGATTRSATFVSGSGTNALLYSYTVQQGDMDMDGITTGTALTGTIRNTAGKDAVLTLNNVAATTGVLVNTAHPSVVLSGNIAARVNTPVTVNITFSEVVSGLTTTGIVASNATVSNLQTTDHINYTAVVTPLTDGTVNVNVPAGAAVNTGGNENTVSNTLSFIYDATPPVINPQTLSINFNSPAGTQAGVLTAADAAGTIQNWMITADGSGGAFAIDATGAITVKDAAILSSKAGTTVSVTVTVSDGLNTSALTTISINISAAVVNQPPTLDAIADVVECAGTEEHTIQLKGISAVEPGQTYNITVTADQSYFDILTVTNDVLHYQLKSNITSGQANVTVTVKDNGGTANGGVDTQQRTFSVTINTPPTVTISSNKGNTVSKGDIIQLTATGGNNYHWTTVDGIISGQQTAVLQARIMVNTTYEVTAVSAAGCQNTGSINIAVVEDFKVESTNILTPNGDGKNDRWVIRNIDSYPNNEVKVYDRAGRMVYQRRNYSNDWDGTMNGSPLPEGTYYYILTISGSTKTAKGYITIIRDQQ